MSQTGSREWFEDAATWGWNKQGTPSQRIAAITYLNAIKHRKSFLWNLSSSVDIALRFKEKILAQDNNKVLLFSELTSQADRLSKYSIHSNNDEITNKQLLYSFDTGSIRELASVNSLTLGLNLVGANWAIFESFNSSETSIKQKAGRLDRLSTNDVSNIIFIVPKDTQAEQWFNNFSKSLDLSEAVYLNNINELII
jgi:superfamily II DNA or RNA helicase